MAGGTKTFLQGKIIMSQPPSVIAYWHIFLCSLAVSNWGWRGMEAGGSPEAGFAELEAWQV